MDEKLTIGLTGDVMLGRTLDKVISEEGYDYPWGNLLPLMKATDMNIINLETTLTNSNKKVPKTFNFRAAPDKIESLIKAHVTIANLANNHIFDFHTDGLLETIKVLDRAGIKHVGAGKDLKEAAAPAIIEKNDLTVGVLGLTDNEPGWAAYNGPGTNYVDIDRDEDCTRVLNSIAAIRNNVDIVIVSIHWGPNMREEPTSRFVKFAHLTSQHGAHIVHGHSAHILQGIEYYNNSLIFYDTGDFVDDYAVDPLLRNDLSAFFILSVNKSGIQESRMIPVRISEYQVNKGRKEDRDWVIRRMQQLSSAFGTRIEEDGKVILKPELPQTIKDG